MSTAICFGFFETNRKNLRKCAINVVKSIEKMMNI